MTHRHPRWLSTVADELLESLRAGYAQQGLGPDDYLWVVAQVDLVYEKHALASPSPEDDVYGQHFQSEQSRRWFNYCTSLRQGRHLGTDHHRAVAWWMCNVGVPRMVILQGLQLMLRGRGGALADWGPCARVMDGIMIYPRSYVCGGGADDGGDHAARCYEYYRNSVGWRRSAAFWLARVEWLTEDLVDLIVLQTL